MTKHIILFLAANPFGTERLSLDQEAHAIALELERSGHRDRFELVTRWAVEPLDLLRELRKLKPTVVHFSGHGSHPVSRGLLPDRLSHRDVVSDGDGGGTEPRDGLYFRSSDGRAQLVSVDALQKTFGAAGSSVQLVVLNACYSEVQAEALLTHVGCVVGMRSSISDVAARSFAIGFYGGLGERESVAAAYLQGRAAIGLDGLPDSEQPQLKVRDDIDAEKLVLADAHPEITNAVDTSQMRFLVAGAAGEPGAQPIHAERSSVASPTALPTLGGRSVDEWENCLWSTNVRERGEAAWALGQIGLPAARALPAILEVLRVGGATMDLIDAIGRIAPHDPRALLPLAGELGAADHRTCARAAEILVGHGSAAVEILVRAFEDPARRDWASWALTRIGAATIAPLLALDTSRGDSQLSASISSCIGAMDTVAHEEAARLVRARPGFAPIVLAALDKAAAISPGVGDFAFEVWSWHVSSTCDRLASSIALRGSSDPDLLSPIVTAALTGEDVELREYAIETLKRIGFAGIAMIRDLPPVNQFVLCEIVSVIVYLDECAGVPGVDLVNALGATDLINVWAFLQSRLNSSLFKAPKALLSLLFRVCPERFSSLEMLYSVLTKIRHAKDEPDLSSMIGETPAALLSFLLRVCPERFSLEMLYSLVDYDRDEVRNLVCRQLLLLSGPQALGMLLSRLDDTLPSGLKEEIVSALKDAAASAALIVESAIAASPIRNWHDEAIAFCASTPMYADAAAPHVLDLIDHARVNGKDIKNRYQYTEYDRVSISYRIRCKVLDAAKDATMRAALERLRGAEGIHPKTIRDIYPRGYGIGLLTVLVPLLEEDAITREHVALVLPLFREVLWDHQSAMQAMGTALERLQGQSPEMARELRKRLLLNVSGRLTRGVRRLGVVGIVLVSILGGALLFPLGVVCMCRHIVRTVVFTLFGVGASVLLGHYLRSVALDGQFLVQALAGTVLGIGTSLRSCAVYESIAGESDSIIQIMFVGISTAVLTSFAALELGTALGISHGHVLSIRGASPDVDAQWIPVVVAGIIGAFAADVRDPLGRGA